MLTWLTELLLSPCKRVKRNLKHYWKCLIFLFDRRRLTVWTSRSAKTWCFTIKNVEFRKQEQVLGFFLNIHIKLVFDLWSDFIEETVIELTIPEASTVFSLILLPVIQCVFSEKNLHYSQIKRPVFHSICRKQAQRLKNRLTVLPSTFNKQRQAGATPLFTLIVYPAVS